MEEDGKPIVLFDRTKKAASDRNVNKERIIDFFFELMPCEADEAEEFLSAAELLRRLINRTGIIYEMQDLIDCLDDSSIVPCHIEGETLYPVRNRPLE